VVPVGMIVTVDRCKRQFRFSLILCARQSPQRLARCFFNFISLIACIRHSVQNPAVIVLLSRDSCPEKCLLFDKSKSMGLQHVVAKTKKLLIGGIGLSVQIPGVKY
jgi:hypothetical protein